ncbi:MAG: transglutaminase, partial [Synechococcales bacterium]|nr:transglutaminase [Synechococcales bacterium]
MVTLIKPLRWQNLPVLQRLQRQAKARAPELPEESLLLRILVQLLVSIGIVATDIAAETSLWIWAVPLSAMGAAWSWRSRHKRNIPTKFLLAIGMILALIAFFGRLIAGRESS